MYLCSMENAKKYIIYLRVSTAKQGVSGLGLEAQLKACKAFAGDAEILGVYQDMQSGKDDGRPELAALSRTAKKRAPCYSLQNWIGLRAARGI